MKSTLILAGAVASAVLIVGAGSASAATMTATFKNMSSDTQQVTTSNYNYQYPDSPISAGGAGHGTYQTSSNPNVTANATYQGDATRLGCFFTAQAVYNTQRKRYTFSSNAQSRGAGGGGVTATCTSQITSSNSTTGDFSVSYTISGF